MEQYITSNQILNNLANLPQLVFEVTDICNLKCKYCAYGEFYNDYDNRENKNLSVSTAKQIIDYLLPLWNSARNTSSKTPLYISFYGGEPLVNFDFVSKIVEYVKNEISCPRREIRFTMTTNAVLLHKYMDFLAKNEFGLLISLDGNERNHSYRVDHNGKSSFEQVIKNVDLLQTTYPDYFKNNVNFNSVLHNRSTVEEVYNFIKERYDKIPKIHEINNSGIRPDKVDEFYRTFRSVTESLHQSENYEKIEKDMFLGAAGYRSLMMYLQRYSGNFYDSYIDLLRDDTKLSYIPSGTCIPFSKKMFITVNGKILPCERIAHKYCLGYVNEDSVELNIEKIEQKYNLYFNKLKNACSVCKNQKSCIQCIFNIDSIDNEYPKCHGFMTEKEFQYICNIQEAFLRKHPEMYRKILTKSITI